MSSTSHNTVKTESIPAGSQPSGRFGNPYSYRFWNFPDKPKGNEEFAKKLKKASGKRDTSKEETFQYHKSDEVTISDEGRFIQYYDYGKQPCTYVEWRPSERGIHIIA